MLLICNTYAWRLLKCLIPMGHNLYPILNVCVLRTVYYLNHISFTWFCRAECGVAMGPMLWPTPYKSIARISSRGNVLTINKRIIASAPYSGASCEAKGEVENKIIISVTCVLFVHCSIVFQKLANQNKDAVNVKSWKWTKVVIERD